MKLTLTAIGQDTELSTGDLVHTITFNSGQLRICIPEIEMEKIHDFIKRNAGIQETPQPVQEDEYEEPPKLARPQSKHFYIDPDEIDSNESPAPSDPYAQFLDPYAQKGLDEIGDSGGQVQRNSRFDEEGAIEF